MSTPDELIGQPLVEALILWCDESRLEEVAVCQGYFSEAELRHRGFTLLGGPQTLAEARQDRQLDAEEHLEEQLRLAWDFLIGDIKTRIRREEITLTGVPFGRTRTENRATLPSAWASEFEFDFINDRVKAGNGDLYVAVQAFKGRPDQVAPAIGVAAPAAVTPVTLTADMIAELDDELLLAVLEVHAARVIENGTPMIAPGKISWAPMAARKMRHRASKGEMEASLAAETAWLLNWLKSVTNGYQLPTPKTLSNALRTEYWTCDARSNGIKA